ncbi:pilin [Candidatus Saccharibacteria bacterium]|nr:pilin [Candidatus Saccharibacteria bacterium]
MDSLVLFGMSLANRVEEGIMLAMPAEDGGSLDVIALIEGGVAWLTFLVGVMSVIFIMIGGIRYITSGGDKEKVQKAKNAILYACIGLVIVALSGDIARFVMGLLAGGEIAQP